MGVYEVWEISEIWVISYDDVKRFIFGDNFGNEGRLGWENWDG